jgi:hypothetical protein
MECNKPGQEWSTRCPGHRPAIDASSRKLMDGVPSGKPGSGLRVSGALSPQTSSSEKEYSQEAATCNLRAAVRNLSSGLGSPKDLLESDGDRRERFFPPEDCLDDNEWEGEELLPTAEEEDSSDDSAYQERGVGCSP